MKFFYRGFHFLFINTRGDIMSATRRERRAAERAAQKAARKGGQVAPASKPKVYVLDTNVLVIDPTAVISFKEHDVVICGVVIQELSGLKNSSKESLRYSVPEALTVLDNILDTCEGEISEGICLKKYSGGDATGRIFFRKDDEEVPEDFPLRKQIADGNKDCRIMLAAFLEQKRSPEKEVIIVSRDIDMRLFGAITRIPIEKYRKDRVIEDAELLPSGETEISLEQLAIIQQAGCEDPAAPEKTIKVKNKEIAKIPLNEYVYSEAGEFHARVIAKDGDKVVLRQVRNYRSKHEKNQVYGTSAINREQMYAYDACMDPEIECVWLLGKAGSGKTFIALATAFELVANRKVYDRIMYVCPELEDDHGFVPGTVQDKTAERAGGLFDNVRLLHKGMDLDKTDQKSRQAEATSMQILMQKYVDYVPLTYMRGRSISRTIIIVDETQNQTAPQTRLTASRVGEGSKIIFLGNLAQIDTKYLTAGTCGLAHVVMGLKGKEGCAGIILPSGVRSRIANYANEYL